MLLRSGKYYETVFVLNFEIKITLRDVFESYLDEVVDDILDHIEIELYNELT